MASKPKKRKVGRSTPPLTREQLLPMSAELACRASLHYHMTLATLRRGQGNADLVSVLLKAVYVAHYLLEPEQSATYAGIFAQAETAIKSAIKTAAATSEWRLAESDCEGVEAILRLHDAQLASLPKHRVEGAKDRLMRVLERGSFPNLACPLVGQDDTTLDELPFP